MTYDVFLTYNQTDQAAVELIARRLCEEAGLELFLDRWHLVPGEPWQEALERGLDTSRTCIVFLGPSGLGIWENEAMRAALDIRAGSPGYRVIPALLPGAALPERGKLPRFLARLTWVDFRAGLDDAAAFHALVCGVKGVAPGPADRSAADAACPFRGLEPFDEEHAAFFIGREALAQHLVEQLRGDRFLAVLGPSGSGKSSLVRAGLLPAIRSGALPGSSQWPIMVLKPGPQPIESLAARLGPQVRPGANPLALQQVIEQTLSRDERGLQRLVRAALAPLPDSRRLLLLVDQFEELFTLCSDEDERRRFVDNLLYATSVAGGQTLVVLTMRADFLGKCAAYPELAARMKGLELVGPMDDEDLRRAMRCPAERVGLHYEKGLVETILDDLGREPGCLPLLQHTLLELWERRCGQWLTTDAYQEIGGVKGALARRADAVYDRLTPPQQMAVRQVLLRLTQPGEGTEDTRRRAPFAELLPANSKTADVETVVGELADARLLTTSKDERGVEIVDVAHEALIRSWPRLRGWIDEGRAALRVHHQLTEAAEVWQRCDHDESYLYQGLRLAEAEQLAKSGNLNLLEQEFVEASVKMRQRAQRRRWLTQAGATILSLSVLMLLGVFLLLYARQQGIGETLESLWELQPVFDMAVTSLTFVDSPLPIYYAGTEKGSVGRSRNGKDWTISNRGLPDAAVSQIAVDQENAQHLFAVLSGYGVYKSIDGGTTWSATESRGLPNNGVLSLVARGDLILAVFSRFQNNEMYGSRDGGMNWELLAGENLKPMGKVYCVYIQHDDSLVYIGTEHGIYRSAIGTAWGWQLVAAAGEAVNLIAPGQGKDGSLFYTTLGQGKRAVYRWKLDVPGRLPQRLIPLDRQALALAPSYKAVYIVLLNGEILGVMPDDDDKRPLHLGLYPANFPLNMLPNMQGMAYNLLATRSEKGDTQLFLATVDGLMQCRIPLSK